MRSILLLLCALPLAANVCTPASVPVNGPFPAIVGGVDNLSYNSVRFLWTSDANSGSPATAQRIQYSTNAEWAANPGVYQHTATIWNSDPSNSGGSLVLGSTVFQGGNVTALVGSTGYHMTGQSYEGVYPSGAWCPAVDETFTTTAQPATPLDPIPPATLDTTTPTVTGTDYTYGSTCGTSGTVTARWNDCLATANPDLGDGIGAAGGVYQITGLLNFPNRPSAVSITCSSSTGLCTQTGGTPPTAGQGAVFYQPPSPVNAGVPYKIINVTTGGGTTTFNISYDGTNLIPFLNNGTAPTYYLPYPFNTGKVLIHSTAASNLLPPPGVRVGPDSIAQYRPNMVELMDMDPTFGSGFLNWELMAGGYYFQNIVMSIDPSVGATSASNGLDPIGYRVPLSIGSNPTNHQIIFNQSYFDMATTGPSRAGFITVNGRELGFTNSSAAGLNWWQPLLTVSAPLSTTSNSITIPPMTLYWVGSDGTSATKQSCTSTTGTVSITSGGGVTMSPGVVLSINPNCTLNVTFATGITATASANITLLSTASPYWPPLYTYTGPSGGTAQGELAYKLGDGAFSSGSLVSLSQQSPVSGSQNYIESGNAFYFGGSVRNIFKWDDNYVSGANIVGVFLSDDITNQTTPCGTVNPCPLQFNPGDLTESRSTVTINPCFNPDSPCWNGGEYYGRNGTETKQGARVLQDGNIYGPFFPSLGQGQCTLHETYVGMSNGGTNYGVYTGFPFYGDSSNWTFTNNTCMQTGSGIATALTQNWGGGRVNQNFKLRNNLFLNINGYAQAASLQPYNASRIVKSNSSSNCPNGYTLSIFGGQNFILDHNSMLGSGGCLPQFYSVSGYMPSTVTITNNILNVVNDPGYFASNTTQGVYFGGENNGDPCVGSQGQTFLNCIEQLTFSGNLLLGTWSNSFPGSQVEFTTGNIATIGGYYNTLAGNFFPNSNTLAGREGQIQWFNPSLANLRLASASPYISGAHVTTDGLDVGIDQDKLDKHQGAVNNLRWLSLTSTSAQLGFFSADGNACGLDWSTAPFINGGGSWTRIAGSVGSPDSRVQAISISGVTAHATVFYRLNCQSNQPTGSITLP